MNPASATGDTMLANDSTSAASLTTTSPLTGPSSFGSAVDAQGLPTVPEVPHYKTSHDFSAPSIDHRLQSMRLPSADSRNGSQGSSLARSFDDKLLEAPAQPYGYSVPAGAGPVSHEIFEQDSGTGTMTNGHHQEPSKMAYGHHQEPSRTQLQNRLSKPNHPKKEKKGGFRNTLRRMFGTKRASKDRISMPVPTVYPRHNPEEFITSASNVDSKPQRSASVPASGLPRRSALSSHPPLRHTSVPTVVQPTPVPPQPERRPPERPPRPRSASVPSELLNRDEMQAIEAALADPNLQDKQEHNLEAQAQNIGFAVTNGSNPKRRSRSVGAFPSIDHRMSPIQWHHIRRRSDEIRYWRESTQLSSFSGVKDAGSPDAVSPVTAKDDEDVTADGIADENADIGEHNQRFNFGLPADAMEMQNQERMGLEERLVTLEIKLMDFEYALSKIQAGSTSSRSTPFETTKRQESIDSYRSSNMAQSPMEVSRSTPQAITKSVSHKFSAEDLRNPKPRPISVATTLKPGAHQGTYTSSEKPPVDRNTIRASLTSLTIEHYTTLITLIRHEQTARQRLEEQVTELRSQIQHLSAPSRHRNRSHPPSTSQQSHYSQTSQQRRHGMVEPDDGRRRGPYLHSGTMRNNSYSTTGTDTEDDTYHDVYVTPDITPVDHHQLERGEYERGAFDRMPVGEGVAF